MSDYYTALGLYTKVEAITKAAESVRTEFDIKDGDIEVLSAAAYPDGVFLDDKPLEHQVYKLQHLFPFFIGIGGMIAGITLAGGTGFIMNLNVGGKSPFSYAPTGIITYEFALLGAVIGSVLSILYLARLPNWTERAYDPEISEGALGLLIKLNTQEDLERASSMMESQGAFKVRKGRNDF